MEFELTPELVDQIIFAMEDQSSTFCFDTNIMEITVLESTEEADSNGKYVLPQWSSIEGFQVMEQFVGSLRNPIVRQELRLVLKSGSGVFRKFKDVLRAYPEVEKIWFNHKSNTMKSLVTEWYNQLRDYWGLERIGYEPEEIDDLIETDFVVKSIDLWDDADYIKGYLPVFIEECLSFLNNRPQVQRLNRYIQDCVSHSKKALIVESLDGDFASALLYEELCGDEYCILKVHFVFTLKEYRGLRLSAKLINSLTDLVGDREMTDILFSIHGQEQVLMETLLREGFVKCGTYYLKNLLTV
ncbi:hypothetical protein [Spirochaeta cellobiosiphila]|uniref:hypothetical protein n=1 Tax=Spirochaeta cellobiosiphila TaxID=504483 RepID=UPI0004030EC1|nr:hypothetical protein [Spirochaeta cellobiosiphila]